MLRFTNPDISDEYWFYTSDSGDIRSRKYYEPPIMEDSGTNMYPTPAGFVIRANDLNMKVYPQFSVGVQMRNPTTFEMLIHRRVPYDDNLGLGEGVDDRTFIENSFDIEIGPLTRHCYFRSFIESKYSALLFPATVSNSEIVLSTLSWSETKELRESWSFSTSYSFGINDGNLYLSSAVMKGTQPLLRVFNFNDSPMNIDWKGIEIKERVFLGGYTKVTPLYNWTIGDNLVYVNKSGTGYPVSFKERELDPKLQIQGFDLAAFHFRFIN